MAIEDKPSFTIRVEPALYEKLRVEAVNNKRSLSGQCEYILENFIKSKRGENDCKTNKVG